jgi:hypothetical protein
VANRRAIEKDLALGRPLKTEEKAQQRCLAGSVASEQRDDLTGSEAERHPREDGARSKREPDLASFEKDTRNVWR